MRRLKSIHLDGSWVRCAGAVIAVGFHGFVTKPAIAAERCAYTDAQGRVVVVESPRQAPQKFRSTLRCFSSGMKEAKAVEFSGLERRATFSTVLGRVSVRWERAAEQTVGTSPERSIAEAAKALRRFLSAHDIGVRPAALEREWNIAVFDRELTEKNVPTYLVDTCHPGWMTPPGNIYLVAQRAVAGCGDSRAEASRQGELKFQRVVIHEFAHALEYELAPERFKDERARAEGFAAWVESVAADYLPGAERGQVERSMEDSACRSRKGADLLTRFTGSGAAYAQASQVFRIVMRKRGAPGIRELYRLHREASRSWLEAAAEATGVGERQLIESLCAL